MCKRCYFNTYKLDYIKHWNYEKWHNIPGELYDKLTKQCIVCGFTEFVELHHLDGHKENNLGNNLIGLCSNHHRMIHTEKYKSKVMELIKIKTFSYS